MITPTGAGGEDTAPPAEQRIDEACDRFEAAWKAGQRPRIEAYLGAVSGPPRGELLRELLKVELAYRNRRGDQPSLEEYRARFPGRDGVIRDCFGTVSPTHPPVVPPGAGRDGDSFIDPEAKFDPRISRAPLGSEETRPEQPGATVEHTPGPGSGSISPGRGELPRRFGDYELLQVLGRGGMGIVYLARQIRLNRLVALKMIPAGAPAFDDELSRFQNEAKALAALDHPHIVPIYEVGEVSGRHYFSMKLIAGEGLDRRIEEFRRDPRASARLMVAVAGAIDYSHRRGILHRDIKPANVLLDEHGRPHVTDFGLAKRVAVDSELTASGALLGTPSYMAPEQAMGRRDAVNAATDVYGLGATLYTLLTGRPPFRGDSLAATLEQVRERDPERPSRSNPLIDRDLEAICLKCLEKEPDRRYTSALELVEDLERYLKGERTRSRRTPLEIQSLGSWRRRGAIAGAIASVTLGVICLGLLGRIPGFHFQSNGVEVERGPIVEAIVGLPFVAIFGAISGVLLSTILVPAWNILVVPIGRLGRTTNPLGKVALGLGLVTSSTVLTVLGGFIDEEALLSRGLVGLRLVPELISVLANLLGTFGPTLCLSVAPQTRAQGILYTSVGLQMTALLVRASDRLESAIHLDFGPFRAGPSYLLSVLSFTLFLVFLRRLALFIRVEDLAARARSAFRLMEIAFLLLALALAGAKAFAPHGMLMLPFAAAALSAVVAFYQYLYLIIKMQFKIVDNL